LVDGDVDGDLCEIKKIDIFKILKIDPLKFNGIKCGNSHFLISLNNGKLKK